MTATVRAEVPRPVREMVFAYRVAARDYLFHEVGADGSINREEARTYHISKGAHRFHPGFIYSVEYSPEKSQGSSLTIYPATFKYLRVWPDATEQREWEARDRTVLASLEAARVERKARADSSQLDYLLDNLAQLYRRAPYSQRPALVALVVKVMTQGRG